jgi:hypothetical protein
MKRSVLAVVGMTVLAICGCRSTDDKTPSATNATPGTVQLGSSEQERLRALGYLESPEQSPDSATER